MGNPVKQMEGKVIDDTLVIRFSHFDRMQRAYWQCECLRCGRQVKIRGDNLRKGIGTRCSGHSYSRDTSRQKTKNV